ncbi:unnamed protein product [Lactuca saligna]|uniref:Uncharacterized protein n=1 Tax=Lactuca saligna TaxID=75948 RepID=A0AA35VL97_LACSI|nr:unnamed protein product [Lactuca saligna]
MYPSGINVKKGRLTKARLGQEEHASNHTPVSQTPSNSASETTATCTANLSHPTINSVPQVAIVTTTPQIIATQQTVILVSQQQSFPHTSGIGTWIPHTIQPQPQYSPMVYPHATMAGLPQVSLFIQQPPIFNSLVQQSPGSIPALSQPQATTPHTSTN